MPEYLAPGVYVEETSFRARSIEGVGTSVAAVVGPTRTGPVRGRPEVCTSWADFERVYGDAGDLDFGGTAVMNHTALGARAFFDNGGKQLFVSRVIGGGNATDAGGAGGSAAFATVAGGAGAVRFDARFPGAGGNLTVRCIFGDPQSVLRVRTLAELPDGETALVRIAGTIAQADVTNPGGHGGFPLSALTALVTMNAGTLEFVANTRARVVNDGATDPVAVPVADIGDGIAVANLADDTVVFTQVATAVPPGGAIAAGTPAELVLSGPTDVTDFIPNQTGWGALTALRGTLTGSTFTVAAQPMNTGVAAAIAMDLSALAGQAGAARALQLQRRVAFEVRRGGEPIWTAAEAELTAAGLRAALPADPDRRADRLAQPVSVTVAGNPTMATIHGALYQMMRATNAAALAGSALAPPAHLITLSGGTDGDAPEAADYAGETNDDLGSTGFAALEDVEDVSIVFAPAAAADAARHQAITAAMQAHVNRMRYRVAVVDAREGMALSEVRAFRDNFDDTRMALYYPWVVSIDPTGRQESLTLPPSGFIAGIYARTDVDRGVHKAPANTPVFGALRFAQEINRFQQELLNPAGVNCLRSFPGRGHQVWGGRTMSSDPEWRYVNVRRYFLYLERSIERGMQWAVFEPNGEALWSSVTSTVSDFLYNEWTNGRLLGGSPEAAYFVRCDRSTMTQNDIDAGRLVCLVGVAPLRPAEFVIIRIGQKTADA